MTVVVLGQNLQKLHVSGLLCRLCRSLDFRVDCCCVHRQLILHRSLKVPQTASLKRQMYRSFPIFSFLYGSSGLPGDICKKLPSMQKDHCFSTKTLLSQIAI